MKRWALWLALFLSLGFNLGLVVSRLTERADPPAIDSQATQPPSSEITAEAPQKLAGEDPVMAEDAQASPGQPPRWLERVIVRVADELGLQGEERERFFTLQREYFRRTIQARRMQRRHEFAVRRLLVSGDADRAQVEEALGKVVAAQGEVEQAFLDHYFAARELLGPQQMVRYTHFLGQLRRTSQEMARRELGEAAGAGNRPRNRPGDRPGRPLR
jgi:Spy/CpxP family protein refolding chaperone